MSEADAAAGGAGGPGYLFRLYVAGDAPNSLAARENLRRLCDELPDGVAWRVEVVDLMEEPARSLRDGVLVTPTLLRLSPAPTVAVLGSLADRARVVAALGLAGGRDG